MSQQERRPSAGQRIAELLNEEEDVYFLTPTGSLEEELFNSDYEPSRYAEELDSFYNLLDDHEPASCRDEEEEKAMRHIFTKGNKSPNQEGIAGPSIQEQREPVVHKSKKTKPVRDKAQRERRPSAGNRKAKMLHEEEEDIFHQTTYGGFQEEEDNSNKVPRKYGAARVNPDFEIFKDHKPVSYQDEKEEKAMRNVVSKRNKSPNREWVAGLGKQQPKKVAVNKSKNSKPTKDKAQRGRRPSACNRMAKMLHEEEEDIFHQTTYGGFQEEEDNSNKVPRKYGAARVNSEFEIFKDHKPVSYRDEKEEKAMRHVVSKRNKSPNREWIAGHAGKQQPKKLAVNKSKNSKPTKDKDRNKSTVEKILQTQQGVRTRSQVKKDKEMEERILAEAKITEVQNLISSDRYQHIEMESNKVNPVNSTITGPELRYPSMAILPIKANEPEKNDDLDLDLHQILDWEKEARNDGVERKGPKVKFPKESEQNKLPQPDIEPFEIIDLDEDEDIIFVEDTVTLDSVPSAHQNHYSIDSSDKEFKAFSRQAKPKMRREMRKTLDSVPSTHQNHYSIDSSDKEFKAFSRQAKPKMRREMRKTLDSVPSAHQNHYIIDSSDEELARSPQPKKRQVVRKTLDSVPFAHQNHYIIDSSDEELARSPQPKKRQVVRKTLDSVPSAHQNHYSIDSSDKEFKAFSRQAKPKMRREMRKTLDSVPSAHQNHYIIDSSDEELARSPQPKKRQVVRKKGARDLDPDYKPYSRSRK